MKYLLSLIISGALVVSGFGQTRNVLVNTNNAVVQPTNFWSADASNARSGLGLGTAATNPASAFQPSSLVLSNLASSNGVNLTNINASNIVGTNFPAILLRTNGDGAGLTNLTAGNITGTVGLASNVSGVVAITNGGTGATNAATARTNLGATTVGNSLFTATNAEAALDVLGISTNSSNTVLSVSNIEVLSFPEGSDRGFVVPTSGQTLIVKGTNLTTAVPAFFGFDGFAQTAFSAAAARTNIGLILPALTNTNNVNFLAAFFGANTNPVLVNTNGEVVSPTNFWQVAPITTTFIESEPSTNSSTNVSAARFLHIHSLAPSINGVTNTIVLPTNGSTFVGDVALVVHQGPTSSMTRVRTAGSTNDLVTMTRFDEAVEFVYYNNVWQFNHNISFIEPIYFSGTNAAANAAASRTNLGLGTTNLVQFNQVDAQTFFVDEGGSGIEFNGTNVSATTRTNLGIPLAALTNTNNAGFRASIELGAFWSEEGWANLYDGDTNLVLSVEDGVEIYQDLRFGGTNAAINAATTRTNLGLGNGVTTNLDIKLDNNAGMRLYFSNGILTNAVTPIP